MRRALGGVWIPVRRTPAVTVADRVAGGVSAAEKFRDVDQGLSPRRCAGVFARGGSRRGIDQGVLAAGFTRHRGAWHASLTILRRSGRGSCATAQGQAPASDLVAWFLDNRARACYSGSAY